MLFWDKYKPRHLSSIVKVQMSVRLSYISVVIFSQCDSINTESLIELHYDILSDEGLIRLPHHSLCFFSHLTYGIRLWGQSSGTHKTATVADESSWNFKWRELAGTLQVPTLHE